MSTPVSVWACAQTDARAQRRGRYVPGTIAHPARMLPAIAATAISALTKPGELVFDPMCGAGTTLVEALHLGRDAIGTELEPRWANLARANLNHTRELGAPGTGQVITADARGLPEVLPTTCRDRIAGRVALILTSPPYGPSTHGQVTARPGQGLHKTHFRYAHHARPANLAYQPPPRLLAGLSRILAGCLPLLAPDGHVVITARPWREHGELIDLPGAIAHAAHAAGLRRAQRCVALLAGVRDGHLICRASFFQRTNINKVRAAGTPCQLILHEDVLIFTSAHRGTPHLAAPTPRPSAADEPAASFPRPR